MLNAIHRKGLSFFAAVLSASALSAQDIHFSQLQEAPLLLNPASTGFYDGYHRAILNYKNQWAGMGNPYKTLGASYDTPIIGNTKGERAHLGLGASLFKDKAGDGAFGTMQAGLSVAGLVPVSAFGKFSAGLQANFAQHSGDITKLIWGTQHNGVNFDPALPSNEAASINTFNYLDLGAGIMFEYSSARGTLTGKEVNKFSIGAAMFHLNKPKQEFLGPGEKLAPRLVVHAGGRYDLPSTPFSIIPSAVFMNQAKASEVIFGAVARYRLKTGTKITGFSSESALGFGVNYRLKDAVIPQLYYEIAGYGIGISYDVNLSSYKEVSKMNGGLEISLRYTNWQGALYKKK